MARTAIRDSTHWHELRRGCLGASEVAALFGCGYQSHFQLWHEKKGDLAHEDYSDNERIVLGRCLEDGIAKAAGELYSLRLVKATAHYTDDAVDGRLGATPDYFLDVEDGATVVEVKNASWGAYKDNWIIHEDGFVECPLKFQLQVQAQLACTGAEKGLLLALISGDRLVQCSIPRHEIAIGELRERTRAFFKSLEDNVEPPADMPGDMQAASRVWPAGTGTADMRGDPQIEGWLNQMRDLRIMERQVTGEIDRIRGTVMSYCASNSLAAISANGGRISYKHHDAKDAYVVERPAQPARNELRITIAKL